MKTFRQLQEKAASKQQQKLMGLALAYKRGEVPEDEVSSSVKDMASSMSEKELEDFASTKHKGLPDKVDEGKSSTGYELYHRDFSSAMQHAYKHAKAKLGVDVDPEEIDSKVASGPRKPSKGKTNSYRLLDKGGKKAIQVQVYGMDNGKYELNMYKESVEVNEGLPPHLRKHVDKDGNKVKGSWKNGKWTPNKKQTKKSKFTIKDVTPKGYGPDESVEVNEGFSDSQLAQLKKQYEPLRNKKISMDHNDKLNSLINRFSKDKDALEKIYKADIAFVSQTAMLALMMKHNYKAADLNKLMENVDEAVSIDGRSKTFKETMKRLNVRKQKLAEKEGKKPYLEIGTNEIVNKYAAMTPGQTSEAATSPYDTAATVLAVGAAKKGVDAIKKGASAIKKGVGNVAKKITKIGSTKPVSSKPTPVRPKPTKSTLAQSGLRKKREIK
jgi:hypothetical protein